MLNKKYSINIIFRTKQKFPRRLIIIGCLLSLFLTINARDCIRFKYAELYEISDVIVYARILKKIDHDGRGNRYKLKIKKTFKRDRIDEIRVGKIELKIGEEVIFIGNKEENYGFYYEIPDGGYGCHEYLISRNKSTIKSIGRWPISMDEFKQILKLYGEIQKRSNIAELRGYLYKDPFRQLIGIKSFESSNREIYKNSELIIISVVVDENGKLLTYDYVTKLDRKLKVKIDGHIRNCEWRIFESENLRTSLALIYNKDERFDKNP